MEAAVNEATSSEAFAEGVYREPTDEDMARAVAEMFMTDSPCEVNLDVTDAPVNDNVDS
jgi:hypothetical protein